MVKITLTDFEAGVLIDILTLDDSLVARIIRNKIMEESPFADSE